MRFHPGTLCIVALVALCLSCSDKAKQENPESSKALETASASSSKAAVENLAAMVDLVAAEVNDLPRAEFDPAVLGATIGNDPQKMFEWVRDRTYWAPYRGLLRGPKGVMLDRVGSSLDRAVLLGELLRGAGYTVRLANAQLSEARARDVLGKVRPMPAERRASVAPKTMPAERRRQVAAVMPDLEEKIKKEVAKSSRFKAEAEALVRSQSEMLLAAVRQEESTDEPEVTAAIAALKDHWWIDLKDGNEWVPMDVILPDANAGDALAAAATTSEWRDGDAFPKIPDASWHTVQLRVVVERYEAGATTESTILELKLRPAEQLEQQVTLGHMPQPWPMDLPVPTDPGALRAAALAVREWVPYIRLGDEFIVQAGYTNEGDARANPLESDDDKPGGADITSTMDMALGFGGGEVAPAATAEWLDFEIQVPGSRPERLRRPVFDLLGPARRANKSPDFDGTADLRKLERFEALFSQTDILLQPCNFTEEFVVGLFAAEVLDNQAALRKLSRESDPGKRRQAATEIFQQMAFWGRLPSLVLWRSALADQPANAFLDRPNVLTYRVSQAVISAEKPTFRGLIDIAFNAIGARRDGNRSAFETRIRQGVADTVAEMAVLGSDLDNSENTASIFARLAAESSRGLLIAARDRDAAQALPWPDDEIARVTADVEAGYMTLVPRKAVLIDGEQRVGWWRVDPGSGETVGVMDTGFHQDTGEYTIQKDRAVEIAGSYATRSADAGLRVRRFHAWQFRDGAWRYESMIPIYLIMGGFVLGVIGNIFWIIFALTAL